MSDGFNRPEQGGGLPVEDEGVPVVGNRLTWNASTSNGSPMSGRPQSWAAHQSQAARTIDTMTRAARPSVRRLIKIRLSGLKN